jgi:hypothetical protein
MAETWFLKSKDLYLKQELLYDKLEVIGVTESEIESIEYEIDRIDDEIILEIGDYHNLFFIDEYQDTLLSSKEECLDWIGNTENVRFRNFVFKFWESYPDGLVLFV